MSASIDEEPLATSYETVKEFLNNRENPMEELSNLLKAIGEGQKGSNSKYYEPMKELALLENDERWTVLSQVLYDIGLNIDDEKVILSRDLCNFIVDMIEPVFKGGDALFAAESPLANLISELKFRRQASKIKKVSADGNINELDERFLKACNLSNVDVRTEEFLHNSYSGFDLTYSNYYFLRGEDFDSNKYSSDLTESELAEYTGISDNLDIPSAGLLKGVKSTSKNGISVNLVINTLLFGDIYTDLREYLKNKFQLMAIVELPSIFKRTSTHASLVILRNNSEDTPEEVLLADLKDNFSKREKVIKEWKELLQNEPAYKNI